MLTKNLSSSEITLKKQSKTIYLNYVSQQQATEEGTAKRVQLQSGSGATNASSELITLSLGVINTTPTERARQLTLTAAPIVSVIPTVIINFLLIAAGGSGGGGGGAGGGGAGGVLAGLFSSAVNSTSYTLTVGNYEAGARVGTQGGKAGGDTVFSGGLLTTKTAIGGGGGGGWNDNLSGGSGGSGGGGGGRGGNFQTSGGTGTTGQGNNGGGSSASGNGCGGGGGAGGVGSPGTSGAGGAGGVGTSTYSALLSTITASGTAVGVNSGGTYYIGGGGGGAGLTGGQPGAGAAGGLGGGGNGSPDYDVSTPGAANTGGGGGGGGTTGDTDSYGGTGLGIVYYTNATQVGTGGTVTSSGSGDSKIWYHVYKTVGANTFIF